jgi:O-antigen ligase
MTSKGLRKDADGVMALTGNDIRNIENGMTNYRFENSFSFYKRIYQIIWEVDRYRSGENPSGHSVTQRIEYYKMAFKIIRENMWFGKGTGGYYLAYQEQYDQNKFFQDSDYRQRSHNMFLSYWIDFGLIGLCYVLFALAAPVFLERKTRNYLLMVFLLIVLISFLNEDTLNNHDAISFFAFFYPIFLYSKHETHNPELKPNE